MWLIIDDQKDLGCDVIARTAEAGRAILTCMGFKFDCLCIDHDLGGKETGLDVLKYGIESETLPEHIQLVTHNPVGRENMKNFLLDNGYFSVNGIDFMKRSK